MYVMIFKSFAIIIFLLIAVAYFTLIERKVMASGQRRRGPNVVGYLGLLQPLADGLKLFVKEPIVPSTANLVLFFLAPLISFSLSLIGWLVIPFGETLILSNIELGLIFLLAVSALNVYGILLAGWSGNSKYAFLGSVRSITQMLSYDVALGLIFATVAVKAGSYNLIRVVEAQSQLWYLVPLFPAFMLYSVSALAETNRHPFDLPEAEAELVSGYNVEYSGMAFALFFLGEYANMLLMSAIGAALFLGGWLPILPIPYIPGPVWFGIKILFFVLLFCIARAALPRYRYDQLMFLGWKVFFPITLGWFFLVFTLSILEFNFC